MSQNVFKDLGCESPELLQITDLEIEIERLRAERDHARAHFDSATKLLMSIRALLYPPPVELPDGRTMAFRPKSIDPHEVLQELSDRIRALPDEIRALEDEKTPCGECHLQRGERCDVCGAIRALEDE